MRKKIMRSFKLYEISSVSKPAQEGARATIMKSATIQATAADTAMASIEALADYQGVNIAKFLDTDIGKNLYQSYAEAKSEPPASRALSKRRELCNMFEAFVDAFAKDRGGNRWKATNEFLKTRIGADLYRQMNEAA